MAEGAERKLAIAGGILLIIGGLLFGLGGFIMIAGINIGDTCLTVGGAMMGCSVPFLSIGIPLEIAGCSITNAKNRRREMREMQVAVKILQPFKDKNSGRLYKVGEVVNMDKNRASELIKIGNYIEYVKSI